MIQHTLALAERIVRQLLRDRRFLFYFSAFPILLLYILKVTLDSIQAVFLEFVDMEGQAVGYIAFTIHTMAFVVCVNVLIRERMNGTLDRLYLSSFRKREIVFGYVLGYSATLLMQIPVVLAAGRIVFGLRYEHGVGAGVLTLMLLGIVSIALAILMSNFAENEGQSAAFIPLVVFPSLFLSGLIFPVEAGTRVIQVMSCAVPFKFALDALKGSMLDGLPFGAVWLPNAILLGFIVVTLSLGSLTLRERR